MAVELFAPALAPITDARLQSALDYWRRQSAGKPMPRRADIDPIDIPRLLRDLMLVEVLPSGRYRYRLIGTENAEAHGLNATGRYLDEVLPGPEYKAHVLGLYDEIAVRPSRPNWHRPSRGHSHIRHRSHRDAQRDAGAEEAPAALAWHVPASQSL
jgi:hypothetical protein